MFQPGSICFYLGQFVFYLGHFASTFVSLFQTRSICFLPTSRVHTLFQKQISRTFPGFFQDSDGFFKGSKIHSNPYTPKMSLIILLTALHTLHIFYKIIWFSRLTIKRFERRCFERLVEFSRFPELSRTTGFFSRTFQSWKMPE